MTDTKQSECGKCRFTGTRAEAEEHFMAVHGIHDMTGSSERFVRRWCAENGYGIVPASAMRDLFTAIEGTHEVPYTVIDAFDAALAAIDPSHKRRP